MSCGVVTQFMKDNGVVMKTLDMSLNYSGAGSAAKVIALKAGEQGIKHKHDYPHLSLLLAGTVTVTTDDFTRDLEAPTSIVIQANVYHHLYAHTDALWVCIHASENDL